MDLIKIESFSGQYRFLSNFYPSLVTLYGRIYVTVEHAYQAAKTIDIVEQENIRNAPTPNAAKNLGNRVTLRADWDIIKVAVMYNLVNQKFNLPGLKESLIATGDAELIEGNWWGDTFWGICKSGGRNELGKILMKIRKELIDGHV